MGLLSRGQTALIRRMKDSAGVSGGVTYTRGPTSFNLPCWVGRTGAALSPTESAAVLTWGDRDYLFAVADFDSDFEVPQAGDRITETIGSEDVVFELMPADNGEPCWRFSGQLRTVYRVHVKRVQE